MKVLTYNIRSWYRDLKAGPRNWKQRADRIRKTIADIAPDVILLQEALPPMTARCIPAGYRKASGCSISHHIFVREGFAEVESHGWHIHWTRARLRLPNASRWEVVSIHGHWDPVKTAVLVADLNGIKLNGAALLCGGDWNVEPEQMRRDLYPMAVRVPDGITFRNWESGKTACLDYFAGYGVNASAVRLWPTCSFMDSDHLPVVIDIL